MYEYIWRNDKSTKLNIYVIWGVKIFILPLSC